jgi:hypothetical protein
MYAGRSGPLRKIETKAVLSIKIVTAIMELRIGLNRAEQKPDSSPLVRWLKVQIMGG